MLLTRHVFPLTFDAGISLNLDECSYCGGLEVVNWDNALQRLALVGPLRLPISIAEIRVCKIHVSCRYAQVSCSSTVTHSQAHRADSTIGMAINGRREDPMADLITEVKVSRRNIKNLKT